MKKASQWNCRSKRERPVQETTELALHFLARSEESHHDAENASTSPRTRVLCYFDGGYYAILAALDGEVSLELKDMWDFALVLELAGNKLGFDVDDITTGIALSEVAYDANTPEPDGRKLAEAAAWASRFRSIVGFRLGVRAAAFRSLQESPK